MILILWTLLIVSFFLLNESIWYKHVMSEKKKINITYLYFSFERKRNEKSILLIRCTFITWESLLEKFVASFITLFTSKMFQLPIVSYQMKNNIIYQSDPQIQPKRSVNSCLLLFSFIVLYLWVCFYELSYIFLPLLINITMLHSIFSILKLIMCGFVSIIRIVSLVSMWWSTLECDGRMGNRTLAIKTNDRDGSDLFFELVL